MRKTKCACLQPRGDGIYTIDPRWKGDADKGADTLGCSGALIKSKHSECSHHTLRVHPSFVKLWNEFSFFDAKVTFFYFLSGYGVCPADAVYRRFLTLLRGIAHHRGY